MPKAQEAGSHSARVLWSLALGPKVLWSLGPKARRP